MARGKLFESWSFKLALPESFDDAVYSGPKNFGLSKYNTTGTNRKATLHAPSLRALLAYAKLVIAVEAGADTKDLGAIGHQDKTYRIAEYKSAGKTDCTVFNPKTGKFICGRFQDGSVQPVPYTIGAGAGTGSAMFFCLMPAFEEDAEFRDTFAEFRELIKDGWQDMDAAFNCALVLCDNMYRRIENAKNLGSSGVKLAVPTTGNITALSPLALNSGNYMPTGTLYGVF